MAEGRSLYIYYTAMLVFSSTGAVVNFATVCAILLSKALRKEQNIFTFNLALADCTSAIAIFINNLNEFPEIPFQLENGSWIVSLLIVGLILSILSTLAIAFERFIILRFDALGNRHIVTAKRSISICVIGWIVVTSTYFFIRRFNRYASNILVYSVSPCVILACLGITALCYILIYKKIASISDNIVLNEAALQRRAKNSKKILVTFALVIASTTACWVIICCVPLVETYGALEEKRVFFVLADVGYLLVSINGILNPLIIWMRLTVFRNQLHACLAFSRRICRRSFDSQIQSHLQSDSTTSTTKQSVSTINIDLQDISLR